MRRNKQYLSVFSPSAEKYRQEQLRIRTLFTDWSFPEDVLPISILVVLVQIHLQEIVWAKQYFHKYFLLIFMKLFKIAI